MTRPDPKHYYTRALSDQCLPYLLAAQFRWTVHVIRMDENRIPKQIFYCLLTRGSRSCGGNSNATRHAKANLKSCGIPFAEFESCLGQISMTHHLLGNHRKVWTQLNGSAQGEAPVLETTADCFICDICRRKCGSRIDSNTASLMRFVVSTTIYWWWYRRD